jgi:hypothetical protein
MASAFWFRGQLERRACRNQDGTLCLAVGLRNRVVVGHQLEYRDGAVVYAEPFVNGVLHGLAKQFSLHGRPRKATSWIAAASSATSGALAYLRSRVPVPGGRRECKDDSRDDAERHESSALAPHDAPGIDRFWVAE